MSRDCMRICGALAIAAIMFGSALAMLPGTASGATPHTYYFIDEGFSWDFPIRDNSIDGTNPNGGAVRYWVRDTPAEVNTLIDGVGGSPYPGMSDIIGADGAWGMDYFAAVQTAYMQTEPALNEEIIFVMEVDANRAASPRTYINGGSQIGAVPHGYIWAGSDTHKIESDQIVLPSGSPPTKFFEVLEMAAPETLYGDSWTWDGLKYAQPSDVAGNVLGQIAFWGLMEGAPGYDMDGPWTEVGQAAFGSPINYMQVIDRYYCAVPYFKGGGTVATSVRSLVYSQPSMWTGHYPSRATGPVGTSNSTSLTITFEANCGCFGDMYLYYSKDRNMTWNFIGIFPWTDWGTMHYPWTAPGSGEYWWYTADDELMDYPSSGRPAEAGPYTIQTGAPTSQANAIFPYWRNSSPVTVTANATAYGGATVSNVTLYFSFSSNNVSWSSWTAFGTDLASPWEWAFNWPFGQGYYRFYTYARDSLGRGEEYTPTVDTRAGYDTTPPQHMIGIPMEKTTSENPCEITSNMGDWLSGIAQTDIYYSTNGGMSYLYWGQTLTGKFMFNWPMGEGHYYFKYAAYDRAGNYGPTGTSYDDDWIYQAPPPPYDVPVVSGWNLISFPVDASGSPGTVLDDAGGDTIWDVAKWYDGITKTWKSYRIGSSANTLNYVDRTMGLWVHVTVLGDGYLGVVGNAASSTQVNLYAGWNLVGYPSLTPKTVGNALWGTGANRVEVFDSAPPYVIEAGPDYVLVPGQGFWVRVSMNSVWTVDW